ncbi:Uncharacterised protein [Chromobacterium violaceum]|uniref:Uncharacterized protein n=1 Tax=Chromobacterium violaceum TaxID=536 RepID=A0A447T561_CHRVL|nr:Uncharacterised protein [Chromobacterium violaceum]
MPARIRLVRGPSLPDAPNPEDLPQTIPPYIPVDRGGELVKPGADAACVDDGEHPDAFLNVVLWQARRATSRPGSFLPRSRSQCPGLVRPTRLVAAQHGRRRPLAAAAPGGDAAFRAAFPAAAATTAIWVRDQAGTARILRADGQYADAGVAALLAISKRPARPPMPDSDDAPPTPPRWPAGASSTCATVPARPRSRIGRRRRWTPTPATVSATWACCRRCPSRPTTLTGRPRRRWAKSCSSMPGCRATTASPAPAATTPPTAGPTPAKSRPAMSASWAAATRRR